MSVEGGRVPNSGSEGASVVLGLDPDELEDPTTRDFASLTCLLARISAKDIPAGAVQRVQFSESNKRKHRRFPILILKRLHYHNVPLTTLVFRISLQLLVFRHPYSDLPHLQIKHPLTAGPRSSGYPRMSGSMSNA